MTTNTSPLAYDDCYLMFDRARTSRNGIRIGVASEGNGMNLFTRLNYARRLERQRNKEVYPSDSPLHGVSDYDTLVVRKPREEGGRWWVLIEKRVQPDTIEEIEDAPAPGGRAVGQGDLEPERC